MSLDTLVTRLEDEIPKWMRDAQVPGVSIAVVEGARVAWQRGFGVKDAATGDRVDADTMFEAASMSKPAFAYVVMKLHETRVLDLGTPLLGCGS